MLERGGLGAGRGLAVDERQVDRAVGIGVGDRRADVRVDDLKGDLLATFARERLAGRFAGFDLSPNELPVAAQRLAEGSTPEEITVSSADDAAYNLDYFLFRFHAIYA